MEYSTYSKRYPHLPWVGIASSTTGSAPLFSRRTLKNFIRSSLPWPPISHHKLPLSLGVHMLTHDIMLPAAYRCIRHDSPKHHITPLVLYAVGTQMQGPRASMATFSTVAGSKQVLMARYKAPGDTHHPVESLEPQHNSDVQHHSSSEPTTQHLTDQIVSHSSPAGVLSTLVNFWAKRLSVSTKSVEGMHGPQSNPGYTEENFASMVDVTLCRPQ